MGRDWLQAVLEDLADASGDNEHRTNLGRPGTTLLVDGRPEPTGQGYEAPGFIETLIRAVGPYLAVGVAKVDGVTGAAVGPLIGFDSVAKTGAGEYELTWPLPFYFDADPQGFVQVNSTGPITPRSTQFELLALGDGLSIQAKVRIVTIFDPAVPTDADFSVVVWGPLKRPPV